VGRGWIRAWAHMCINKRANTMHPCANARRHKWF